MFAVVSNGPASYSSGPDKEPPRQGKSKLLSMLAIHDPLLFLIPRTHPRLSVPTNVKTVTSIEALLTTDITDKYLKFKRTFGGDRNVPSVLCNMIVTSH